MWNAATIREFVKYGIVGIIAGVLLGFFLTDVRADQRATRDEHLKMRDEIASMRNITGQSDMAQQQILHVLTTMCVNQARNDFQRGECVKQGGFR